MDYLVTLICKFWYLVYDYLNYVKLWSNLFSLRYMNNLVIVCMHSSIGKTSSSCGLRLGEGYFSCVQVRFGSFGAVKGPVEAPAPKDPKPNLNTTEVSPNLA